MQVGKVIGSVCKTAVKNTAETKAAALNAGDKGVKVPAGDFFKSTSTAESSLLLISHEQAVADNFIQLLKKAKIPKKRVDFFEKLVNQKKLDGDFRFNITDYPMFITFVKLKENSFSRLMKFAECKNIKGEYRFDSKDLTALSKLGRVRYSNAQKLLSLKKATSEWLVRLSSKKTEPDKLETLISAKKTFNENLLLDYEAMESVLTKGGIDLKKLLPRLTEKAAREKGNLESVVIHKADIPGSNFAVQYNLKSGKQEYLLFDEAGKRLTYGRAEIKFGKGGEKICVQKFYDARSNSYSITKSEIKDRGHFVQNETRVIKDKSGKVIRTEILTPSEVEGIYNVKSVDSTGKVTILSSGVKDKNGCVTVKKNTESLDGTKSHYEYYDDPVGNRITYYKITDKKGKVLLDDTQSFEVVSKDTCISSHKGKSFEIKTDEAGMKIRNLQSGEIIQIEFETQFKVQRQELKELLSRVNAEELIALNKKGVHLNYVEGILKSSIHDDKTLDTGKNVFVLEHETGHAKDVRNFTKDGFLKKRFLASNPILNKVYNAEKKLFVDSQPLSIQNHIAYFINSARYAKDLRHPLREVIAESNGVLKSYQSFEPLAIRTNYLQQFFPRTIAKAAELFGKLD